MFLPHRLSLEQNPINDFLERRPLIKVDASARFLFFVGLCFDFAIDSMGYDSILTKHANSTRSTYMGRNGPTSGTRGVGGYVVVSPVKHKRLVLFLTYYQTLRIVYCMDTVGCRLTDRNGTY